MDIDELRRSLHSGNEKAAEGAAKARAVMEERLAVIAEKRRFASERLAAFDRAEALIERVGDTEQELRHEMMPAGFHSREQYRMDVLYISSAPVPLGMIDAADPYGRTHGFARVHMLMIMWEGQSERVGFLRRQLPPPTYYYKKGVAVSFHAAAADGTNELQLEWRGDNNYDAYQHVHEADDYTIGLLDASIFAETDDHARLDAALGFVEGYLETPAER